MTPTLTEKQLAKWFAQLPPADLVRRELDRNAHEKKLLAKLLRITAAAEEARRATGTPDQEEVRDGR